MASWISHIFIIFFFAIYHGWSYFISGWHSSTGCRIPNDWKERGQVVLIDMCYRWLLTDPYDYSNSPLLLVANITLYRSSSMKNVRPWRIIAFIFCSYIRSLFRCRGDHCFHLDGRKEKKKKKKKYISFPLFAFSGYAEGPQNTGIHCFQLRATPWKYSHFKETS